MADKDWDNLYLKKVLDGDKDSFRYFIREYQQMAYSLAISMVKNKEDAEDVVQNAFVQAFKSIRSFKSNSKFSTWLYKIVVNESLKFLKKNKNKAPLNPITQQSLQVEYAFNNGVDEMDLMEQQAMIHSVLLMLKPKEALVLKMHYLHELSIKEIRESTGFSIANIKVLLFRARKNFMEHYLNTNKGKNE